MNRPRRLSGRSSPGVRPGLGGLLACVLAALLITGCGSGSSAPDSRLTVVAAENFWGSIASQLAGSKAHVQSVISNPASDPHSYEPTAGDARTLATAQLVIVNGVGYDAWATRLLSANPVPGRTVLNVGNLFGLREGDNPHRWYDPADVSRVAAAITADLRRLDQHDAAYFASRLSTFENGSLAHYHQLIAAIKARYAGVAVGASESVFALLAPSLGLHLITPASFMKAITEGTEVSARDIATAERQLTSGAVKVWIYNSQNATPQIEHLNSLARDHRVPLATITETLSPANASFEDWQVSQLERISTALHLATGR